MYRVNKTCAPLPLSKADKIQILGDYCVAIFGLLAIGLLYWTHQIKNWVMYAVFIGFLLGCPTEYIFPRIGWVYYYKCITYKYLPVKTTWILHSIWDSFILLAILTMVSSIWSYDIFKHYSHLAAFCMSTLGMIQEIMLEVYQTIWYYKVTKYNPAWAKIKGKKMTLQQWHWSILPPVYYIIMMHFVN